MSDSAFTNISNTHRRRFIGGYFMFPSIPLDPKGIWEEGGNVNNIYIVIGFGGKILCNVADSSNGFTLQAFSDFLLMPNRVYHLGLLFDGDLGCRAYIDGVLQTGFDGVAPNSDQATHSGDYSFGQPDGSLDTGGTDIQYPSFDGARYNDWATWSDAGNDMPSDTDIRVELVEKGARQQVDILSDTEANMQLAIDMLSGTNYEDVQLALRINKPTDQSTLSLDFNNITFGERTSIQLIWMGTNGQTLTITNEGTSNVTASKCSTAYGGSLVIREAVPITVTVNDIITGSPIQDARVYLTAGPGGSETQGAILLNSLTDSSGVASVQFVYSSDQPIIGRVRKSSSGTLYKTSNVIADITSDGLDISVFMIRDS